jgi:hypothetical protein
VECQASQLDGGGGSQQRAVAVEGGTDQLMCQTLETIIDICYV